MFGEYSIKQKNIVVKNNITEKGKKQILNILSKNEKEVGYKKINHKGNIYPEITQTQYYYFKGDVSYIVPCYGEITEVNIVSKNKGVLSNSIFNVTTKKITLSSTTWDEVKITLTCKTKKEYKSTFFDFGTVSHPYNYLRSSSYKNLTSNVIAGSPSAASLVASIKCTLTITLS